MYQFVAGMILRLTLTICGKDVPCFRSLVCLIPLSVVFLAHSAAAQSESEVHAVGLYQGGTPRSSAYRAAVERHLARCEKHPRKCNWGGGWDRIEKRFPFKTTVKLSRTGVPLTLVLSAYDRTVWRIDASPGVILQRIILSGYDKQTLEKTKAIVGVPVTSSYYGNPSVEPSEYFHFHQDDREAPVSYATQDGENVRCEEPISQYETPPHDNSFQNALDYLMRWGLTPVSVQGSYEKRVVTITDLSSTNTLEKRRYRAYCYRNADGSLSPGATE